MINIVSCSDTHKGRICVLQKWHEGYHVDETGFKFMDEDYPNDLGNNPAGYPMNNKAFDEAAAKVIERNKPLVEQAERFMKTMQQAFKDLERK